jgi:tetratricopeptide (TPR) repeat protein
MVGFDKKKWGMAALLMLLTFVVCLPALKGGFLWDDDLLLTDNPLIHSADGLWHLWLPVKGLDYYPLTWTTFWLEWRLWGMNAMGYHATNVLFHALGAFMIWRILEHLQVRGAWLAALIFAVHPVNTESVAWIAERKNTLSLVFYAATMLSFLHFERNGKPQWYWGAVGLFALALLSKTSGVTLPGVFLLCAWWQRGRIGINDWLRTIPFFALAAVFALVTIWSQQWLLGGSGEFTGQFISRPLLFRLGAAGHVFWFYIFKALAPVNLMAVYPVWNFHTVTASFWLPSAAVAGVVGVTWRFRATWGKGPLFALLYCGGILLPVLGVMNAPYIGRSPVVTDHLQYLATIGVISLVVAGLVRLPRPAVAGCTVFILGTLGALSWHRALCYQNQEKFWRDTIAKNPQAGKAHYNLGVFYDKSRRYAEAIAHYTLALECNPHVSIWRNNLANLLFARGQVSEAFAHYAEAIRLRPNFGDAHGNWANALARNGQYDEAIARFKQAIRCSPLSPEIRKNYGLALLGMGKIPEAIAQFRAALRLNPNHADALSSLANALARQGNTEEDLRQFTEALRLQPNSASIHYNYGVALLGQKRPADAAIQFQEALRLKPGYAEAHCNFGNALLAQGRFDDALAQYTAALRSQPDYAAAHYNWGLALARRGRLTEAIQHFNEAVRLDPNDADTHNNLGVALAQQGRITEARAHFAEAVRLNPNDPDYRRNLNQSSGQP